jgi:hypothetical protein
VRVWYLDSSAIAKFAVVPASSGPETEAGRPWPKPQFARSARSTSDLSAAYVDRVGQHHHLAGHRLAEAAFDTASVSLLGSEPGGGNRHL